MCNTLTRIFALALLTMVSMGAKAEIDIKIEKFTGGEITATQGDEKNGEVEVTLTVAPAEGYTISKDDIEVYTTISPNGTRADDPQISSKLELKGDDPKDLSEKRDYTVTVKSTFGVWVKEAKFKDKNREGAKSGTLSSGLYYIVSGGNNGTNNQIVYNSETPATNYYLCPTESWYYYQSSSPYYLKHTDSPNNDNGMPFMTTYQCLNDNNYDSNKALWCIKKKGDTDYYYIIHVVSGKYLTYNDAYFSNTGRVRVHLEDYSAAKDDYVLYKIEYVSTFGSYDIISKYAEDNNTYQSNGRSRKYLNVNKGNRPSLIGTDADKTTPAYSGGIIGFWTYGAFFAEGSNNNDQNSRWQPQSTLLTAPTISFIQEDDKFTVTITESNSLPAGYTILYTTNGDDPSIGGATTSPYTNAVTISENCTVKAVVARYGVILTEIASQFIGRPDAPTITPSNDCTNMIEMSAAVGTSIYYTLDGTLPDNNSTPYTEPFVLNEVATIKAIAYSSNIHSDITTYRFTSPYTVKPTITSNGAIITITGTGSLYYTTDGTEPDTGSTPYTVPFTLTGSSGQVITVKAVAKDDSKGLSCVVEKAITMASYISNLAELEAISSHPSDIFVLSTDIDASGLIASISGFTGEFDGGFYTISGLTKPLFDNLNGATVKNVILDNVTISGGTNAGAICNQATGDSRIYNCGVLASGSTVETDDDGYTHITSCSSTISGSDNVGGIVGLLEGSSRVINCFSYANITGGNLVGGIVGNNNVATTSTNLKTMVMNCMFYGDITGGSSKAPIYNGKIITNRGDASGVSNFNYFWAGASYVQNKNINVYNCALSAETRYLQRFEFFRHLLNSNRALAAWWATGDADNKDNMMKWVLEPSQIGTATPYPILKPAYDSENHIIKYYSVVNYAPNETVYDGSKENRNKGQKLTSIGNQGKLSVTIQNGTGGPTGASISTSSLSLTITDKDFDHFNFNYGKVQLPYYNDVGSMNYTDNKVVTGWEVTVSGGTNNFSNSSSDASASVNEAGDITLTTPYNFADRKSTGKDDYATNGNRIFNQGAYFDVPEGVTSITIKPHWAKCVYVSDQYPDVVYNKDMTTAYNVTTVGGGEQYSGNTITIDGSTQTVNTSMSAAVTALNPSGTVYDNAIVLVGNVHSLDLSDKTDSKPYTIMSIDLDKDNEPDYSYILRFDGSTGRLRVHPVRVDFLNVIGLGMAQKSTGGQGTYNFGIMQPLGWFEATNTALFRVTQFEYDRTPRLSAPMILHGGVIEQWVTVAETSNPPKPADAVTYYHVGSNVWFKEFHIGAHQDRQAVVSQHPPISVTGGDFDEFYLTGLYNTPNTNYDDNAECYINGGRFGKVAGTGMQGIGHATNHTNGNIIWQIDNADIDEFYAGGINAAHIAEGNIYTVISNSRVDQFCGGPKFGDMNNDKKVVTNASNCVFRTFFGAGYGGNSYNREYPTNKYQEYNYGWNTWLAEVYKKEYKTAYKGVSTRIDYQFIPRSNNLQNVARLFVDYISFSLATTRDVTSKLNGCTITKSPLGRLDLFDGCIGNFYGGGSLGKVDGPVKSTLTNCTVEGNVFGAGYSASLPIISVMDNSFQTEPSYDANLGAYLEAKLPTTTPYTWAHRDETINSTALAIDKTNHILYTNEDLTALGKVTGTATLNIGGTTTVAGDVYGGGESSDAMGSVVVNMNGGTVSGDIYGGGALANTNTSNPTDESGNLISTYTTTVNLKGGTVRDVYGGGLGRLADTEHNITAVEALVNGDVTVYLNSESSDNCKVGQIFGCNNINGTPKGHVKVHVYRTAGSGEKDGDKTLENRGAPYDVQAIYGGGNKADYIPASDTENTEVIIEGCGLTSIQNVYGGGNAAATPATELWIMGNYIIDNAFGGGNGTVTAANVGYRSDGTTSYGKGTAITNLVAGYVHEVYGGSNSQGNIREGADIKMPTIDKTQYDCCANIFTQKIYGGGKNADMEGGSNIVMGCMPGDRIDEVYGGAEMANVNGNVSLTITSGIFGRVFGGNKTSGMIKGSITVNIEETGECQTPIIIGELYGGGNLAGYSVYGYETDGTPLETSSSRWDDPQVNVRSFTSIGAVYGGGYKALMVGNPHVNINVVKGSHYNDDTKSAGTMHIEWKNAAGETIGTDDLSYPEHKKGDLGAIGNVFGGGNQARVVGDTYVNIGTANNITFVTPESDTETARTKTVEGANIVGNVYGGGNMAEVTGSTNVRIGQDASSPSPSR